MRHPLWAANCILIALCAANVGFIFLSRPAMPTWESLDLSMPVQPIRQRTSEVNIRQIYENDLFGSYQRPSIQPKQSEELKQLPTPPAPKRVTVPEEPRPTFLQPLSVTLKGILYIINDENKNRACIVELKTKQEKNYKVGDFIEDAQLIKIFNKKVILLRANGQQEILYLRALDAEQDPAYVVVDGWEHVAQPLADNRFVINIQEFVRRVKSLAQFIDLLDLTTAYRKGASIGCSVGQIKEGSLGGYLGLRSGDVIMSINGIAVADTSHRLQVYKTLVSLRQETTITVNIVRKEQPLTLYYTITDLLAQEPDVSAGQLQKVYNHEIHQEKMRSLEERHKFAPTLKEIAEQERQHMRQTTNFSGPKKLTTLLTR